MTTLAECPSCEQEIDATAAAARRACPECEMRFGTLVEIRANEERDEPTDDDYYPVEP